MTDVTRVRLYVVLWVLFPALMWRFAPSLDSVMRRAD